MTRLPKPLVLVILLATILVAQVHADSPAINFQGADWIWTQPDPAQAGDLYPAGSAYFRGVLVLPEKAAVKAADAFVTADNLYTFYLNGQAVGQSTNDPNAWNRPKRFDVTGLLKPGGNVVAVEAVNTAPGPAGLLVKVLVRLVDGREITWVTDPSWRANEKIIAGWQQPTLDDKSWPGAHDLGIFGTAPWGRFADNLAAIAVEAPWPVGRVPTPWKIHAPGGSIAVPNAMVEQPPPDDYAWPQAIAFLGDDASLYRGIHGGTSWDSLGVTMFTARKSRSYPEHDLPSPLKFGHTLYLLKPARPGVKPRLLVDAGKGVIGPPSVSFDGRSILLAMARDGESFFHVYRLDADGGTPVRLTDGPFHDIDPAELPDGRIVFTSTRIGTFEEYHNPPSRALFTMNADGSHPRPLTHTFVFDNEPQVMADGRILFIRSDNFFGRGKVETLLHAMHPDGTHGYTEFGLDLGPEYGGRLRAFYCGSPTPMPDGRVAYVSGSGITVGRPGSRQQEQHNFPVIASDVSALPDGRLLCTVARVAPQRAVVKKQKQIVNDLSYEKISVLDPRANPARLTLLYQSSAGPIHAAVYVGPRPRPPSMPEEVAPQEADHVGASGFFFCQNARFTKNSTAGWPHVRAIRVLGGKGLTMRSSHSYIVHAGSEVEELGTVPLAADGSFSIEVPADRAIAFQAVDAEGRSELNEMSWIYVRPGEHRGCLGCHQERQAAPSATSRFAQALKTKPLKLLGQGKPFRFRGNNAAVTGLMELQFDRFREVAGINRHSETADPLATSSQEVAGLIDLLQGDDGLKISAAQRLAIFRDAAAAPALAASLEYSSREARVAAALALATCGTRASVEPLLKALSDADPLVTQAASVALENLTGHAEPFDAFAPSDVRSVQVQTWRDWFRATTWDAMEKELAARLESADRDVVRRAAVALGHVGSGAARAALRQYVAGHRNENPYPEWMKSHRGDGARFNASSAANPRTLQAATRALGYLRDTASVPLLAETISQNSDPAASNLFLAEACAEALGRIGTPEAEAALIQAHAGLKDYFYYVGWYGDHSALFACHASPVHYFIAQSLDALGSTRAGTILPNLIRSLPTDPDRALLPVSDDCETIVGRVVRRSGAEAAVVETCLAILGDPQAKSIREIEEAISMTYRAWGGKPDPENRAAQILSAVCREQQYEPRIRAALDRYRQMPTGDMVRAFAGGGLPRALPKKHWVCFFLARSLGNLGDPRSVDSLTAVLQECPAEATSGRPDPSQPEILFLHNELTPCYRAAAAWALGRIGDRRATPVLLHALADQQSAPDTHYAAAEALDRLADPASRTTIQALAEAYPEVSTRKVLLHTLTKLTP